MNDNRKHSKSNGRNRGSNRRNKGKGKEMEMNVEDVKFNKADLPHVITSCKSNNDPAWYGHIYPLLKDVASLPYSIPVGTAFNPYSKPLYQQGSVMPAPSNPYHTVPGVMTIEIAPTLGVAKDSTSAPNIAAQQLYTLVRKANSGAVNYDKTDLMMLVLAMDSAYMLYEMLLRAYRTLGVYNYMNRYLPDALMISTLFSPELANNMADFRGVLDLFAYQLASINVPDQFAFIQRHSWLFSNYYKDSDSQKAQIYSFIPQKLFVWTEGTGDAPTSLKATYIADLFQTNTPAGEHPIISNLTQIRTAINTIMKPLLGSQDVGTMSGDLAKAFGEGGMIKIQAVEDHAAIEPVYDMEVIQQMMNATIIDADIKGDDIVQEQSDLTAGPYLVSKPYIESNMPLISSRKSLLNVRADDPNPELTMVATRLCAVVDNVPASEEAPYIHYITSCGTEIVPRAYVWRFVPDANGFVNIDNATALEVNQDFRVILNVTSVASDEAEALALIATFDNHPSIYIWEMVAASGSGQFSGVNLRAIMQDFDNYTFLEDSTITQLNDVAVMSEFAVKDYGVGI